MVKILIFLLLFPIQSLIATCTDYPNIGCSKSSCSDPIFVKFCPVTCNLCGGQVYNSMTSLPGSTPCMDDYRIGCAPNVCLDSYFKIFCPKTCGRCSVTSILQTSKPSGCVDDFRIACTNIVCSDPYFSIFCPFTCNRCSAQPPTTSPVLHTTSQPASITTSSVCQDDPVVNCSPSVCSTLLKSYCRATCQLCTTCADNNFVNCHVSGICSDPTFHQYCPLTCGTCPGTMPMTTTNWIHITLQVGK